MYPGVPRDKMRGIFLQHVPGSFPYRQFKYSEEPGMRLG